jgi:hypothetical protein
MILVQTHAHASCMAHQALNVPCIALWPIVLLQLKQATQQAASSSSIAVSAAAVAATAAGACNSGSQSGSRPSSAAGSNMEDLHSQVIRLKRQRDKLMRDQQELSRQLADTRLELQGAQHRAAESQVGCPALWTLPDMLTSGYSRACVSAESCGYSPVVVC